MSRPKGSKNKKKSPSKVAKIIKRKVGRPKKIKVPAKKKAKKKVGRPKKVKSEKKIVKKYAPSKYNNLPDDYVQPKTYKIAGFCPKCDLCIMPSDFVSKLIFECPCGTRKHKKYLKKKSARVIKQQGEAARISKKEYLKDASSKIKDLEMHHKSTHHISDVPIDVSIMSGVKD